MTNKETGEVYCDGCRYLRKYGVGTCTAPYKSWYSSRTKGERIASEVNTDNNCQDFKGVNK